MKKLLTIFSIVAVLAFAITGIGQTVQDETAGAISNQEQTILDNLNRGIKVSNKTFHIPSTDSMQAENYLKSHEVKEDAVKRVNENIDAARKLIESSSASVNTTQDLKTILKSLPNAELMQLQAYIKDAAEALGLKATFTKNGVQFTDAITGTTVGIPNDTAVKNTGFNSKASISVTALFVMLAVVALGIAQKNKSVRKM